VTDPELSAAQPKVSGRVIALGIVLGLILVPLTVFGAMEVINRMFFECRDSGAEGSLACALRQVVITALFISVGAPLGFFVAYAIGRRRLRR